MDEELKQDQEALKVPTPEEIRANVISEYGFDETVDAERIDKLVAKETEHRKKLSGAIGAKIKHRTDAETLRKGTGEGKNGEGKTDKTDASKKTVDITPMDTYALVNAKVPEEDIPQVQEYAALKGISVAEALKSPIVKTILADAAETRRVAAATHTGGARRSTSKPSADEILAQAKGGQVPDDDAGMDALVDARMGSKKAKK